jgi:3-polyprenyl-4-hydroxybenzoate decarboxylase
MGTGQLSLTKAIVLVDEHVNPRDRAAVFHEIARHFDAAEDFLLLPGVPLDTLDFTSYTMNLGSKMILDAQSKPDRAPRQPLAAVPDPRAVEPSITAHRLAWGGMLVVQVPGTAAASPRCWRGGRGRSLIAAVSPTCRSRTTSCCCGASSRASTARATSCPRLSRRAAPGSPAAGRSASTRRGRTATRPRSRTCPR